GFEIADVDGPGPLDLAVHDRERLRRAAVAAVSFLGEGVRRDVAELSVEIAMVGAAPKLAVGRTLEAEPLLQRDRAGDRLVFRARQVVGARVSGGEAPARGEQFRRPQQAADVLGAKWRHGPHPTRYFAIIPASSWSPKPGPAATCIMPSLIGGRLTHIACH